MNEEILKNVQSQILDEKTNNFKTGFNDLDTILSTVDGGSLITIGSRPAMGKTAFMLSIMINLLSQGEKCLLFSLEMSEIQILKRILSQIGDIDILKINCGNLIPQDIEKIKESVKILSKYDLTINDKSVTFEDIKQEIELKNPKYVFIDYIQLMNLADNQARNEAITNVIQGLKVLAKENNCTIILNSQLSRAVERRNNKRPMLSDLKESDTLEDVSDIVMFIYRDEYYNWYQEDGSDNLYNKNSAEIIVAKNKLGPVGTARLLFKSNISKFYNIICEYVRN